jgi:hypothetical protein
MEIAMFFHIKLPPPNFLEGVAKIECLLLDGVP